MVPTIAPLTTADELLNHQIANTHAAVGTADRAWTEKIWFTLMRKDATLQASFGLGKYTNRDVLDGFAGVAYGTEQRTIRASRVLRPAIEDMAVGPLRYEVVEPFKALRLTAGPNAAQPFQYDLTFTDRLPAFFEGRDLVVHNGRTASDLIRYHQAGTVSGWIEIAGERVAVNPEDWFGFRDHSWGLREHVGVAPVDLPPAKAEPGGKGYHFNWLVSQITRPDGSLYELAYYFRDSGRDHGMDFVTGHISEADGLQIPILHIRPEITYRASDKAMMSGKIHVLTPGRDRPVERVFEIEAINPEMGFRLHPAMYGEWKGQVHGAFKGEDFLDGEHVEDVNSADKLAANYRWQIRDRPLRVREGENYGFADVESIIMGDFPTVTLA